MAELVFLKNFATYSEAEMVKDILTKYEIEGMIQKGDLAAGADFSGYSGDANLYVKSEDLVKSKEILGSLRTSE